VPAARRFFWCARPLLMGAHAAAIHIECPDRVQPLAPLRPHEPGPGAAGQPAAEAVVDRVPLAEAAPQVEPGRASAGELQDRLNEVTITRRRRRTSAGLQSIKGDSDPGPRRVGQQHADFVHEVGSSAGKSIHLRDRAIHQHGLLFRKPTLIDRKSTRLNSSHQI